MASAQEIDFGRLLVEHRLVTPEQVNECLAIQAREGRPLSAIVVERGYLDLETARRFHGYVSQQHPAVAAGPSPSTNSLRLADVEDQRLGQLLMQSNLASREQLSGAFQQAQSYRAAGHRVDLGHVLVQHRILDAGTVERFRALVKSSVVPAPLSSSDIRSATDRFGRSSAVGVPPTTDRFTKSGTRPGTSDDHHSGRLTKEGPIRDDDPITRKFPSQIQPDGSAVVSFGDYDILSEVARGGMGIVYRAVRRGSDHSVALKLMKRGESASERQIRRFQQETEAMRKLEHPNIVAIHEVGCIEGFHFYTMELIEGGPLDIRIKRGLRPGIEDAVKIVRETAEALHYAHNQKIVHRDLKPANILMDTDGHPKVTDFGLAKDVHRKSMLTRTGAVVGTPYYMPPEQARGDTDIDGRCDVYAMGVILYELITGKLPFKGETSMEVYQRILEEEPAPPSGLNPKVERDLETICLKAIEKDRERRYATALDLAEDLGRYAEGKPIKARRPGFFDHVKRWGEEHRRGLRLATASLIFLLVAGSIAVSLVLEQRRAAEALRRREGWAAHARAVTQRLEAIRGRLVDARDSRRKADQQSQLAEDRAKAYQKAEVALGEASAKLDELRRLAEDPAFNNAPRDLQLYLLSLDPRIRAALFADGRPRPEPDFQAFEAAAARARSLDRAPGHAWTEEEVSAFLDRVRGFLKAQGESPPDPRAPTVPTEDIAELYQTLLFERGQLLAAQGERAAEPKILECYRRGLEHAEGSPLAREIRLELGDLLLRRGEFAEALTAFDTLVKRDPEDSGALLKRGLTLRRLGRLKEALADYAAAIKRGVSPEKAYLHRGRLYAAIRRYTQAEEDLSRINRDKDVRTQGALELGRVRRALGELEKADYAFANAVDWRQNHHEGRFERARLALERGDLKLCREMALEIQRGFPKLPHYRWLVARLAEAEGDLKAADEGYRQAIEAAEDHPELKLSAQVARVYLRVVEARSLPRAADLKAAEGRLGPPSEARVREASARLDLLRVAPVGEAADPEARAPASRAIEALAALIKEEAAEAARRDRLAEEAGVELRDPLDAGERLWLRQRHDRLRALMALAARGIERGDAAELLSGAGDTAEARYARAVIARDLQGLAEAEAALRADEGERGRLYRRGVEPGRPEKTREPRARAALARLLVLDPFHGPALVALARLELGPGGDLANGVRAASRALWLNARDSEALKVRAALFDKLGKGAEANKDRARLKELGS